MSYIPDSGHPVPPARTPDRQRCGTALFEINWPQQSTAILAVHGEVDAANSDQLVDFVLSNSEHTDRLVIDLSGLSFFAAAGFAALHTLNTQWASHDIRWAAVSSPAVNRLLRICDPDSTLPIHADIAGALTRVHTEPPRLLQLVSESS